MSLKRTQILFFLGVVAIALNFSIQFWRGCNDYFSLQKEARARILQWETIAVKDRFALVAKYEFENENKICQGSHKFDPPYYLNEPAAFEALKAKAKENWDAWYDPKNPCHTSLEKSFPTGLAVRTAICYGVLIYFFYLYKRMVRL